MSKLSSEDYEKLLTPDQQRIAIELAAKGATLKTIRADIGINAYHFWKYRVKNTHFRDEFNAARAEGMEEQADQLLDIVEEEADVIKARLKSDNIKWLLSKRKASTYGDRIDMNVNQLVDIGQALLEAKQRASPDADPRQVKEVDSVTIPNPSFQVATGSKPADRDADSIDLDEILK